MASLRPHRNINFVGLWKYGFGLSALLIILAVVGLVVSLFTTGSPLTLGTEFSGGTSIQITNTDGITEDEVKDAFNDAVAALGLDVEISSLQTSSSATSGDGFIIKTANNVASDSSAIMANVESTLDISEDDVQINTISASWGASVIWRSFLAFILSCLAILIVIAARYREPRMGAVALITLFHDLLIVVGIYAWAGIFFGMEVTSDVIAALLAIIGYSLYDTIVSFHRINENSSPQMRMSMKACANMSVNQIFMRSLNTSITSILPILLMLVLGTDTLRDFAFAMFCGMVIGIYSTFAISTPIYTMWKIRDPKYKALEEKFPYEVVQSPFTKEMLKEARKASKQAAKDEKAAAAAAAAELKAEKAAEAKKAAEQKAAEEAEKKAEEAVEAAEETTEETVEAAEEAVEAAEETAEDASEAAEEAVGDASEAAEEIAEEAADSE